MDAELPYLMHRYVGLAQPYCDEEVFAAAQFKPGGYMKAGFLGGMFGGGVQKMARERSMKTAGGLPPEMYLVIGPTRVYILAARLSLRDVQLSGPIHVWRRDDLEVAGDPRGLFAKIELHVKSTDERYALESPGKTGGFKKIFEAIRELLSEPSMALPQYSG